MYVPLSKRWTPVTLNRNEREVKLVFDIYFIFLKKYLSTAGTELTLKWALSPKAVGSDQRSARSCEEEE